MKKILTIVLTALLFLSAVILGGTTVFRVDDVAVVATVISEQAKAEAEALRGELVDLYKNESIFSAEKSELNAIASKYPYFQVTAFEKSYPNKIVIRITEDAEIYAVENTDGSYYILGNGGCVLAIRDASSNRLDGAENVLLKGLNLSGVKGEVLNGDECWDSLFTLCKSMDEALGGIRSNVVSVEVLTRTPETFYLITMREGVKIYVGDPSVMTEEKGKKAMDEYMALSDAQRMSGRLTVRDAENKVFVAYSPEDEFDS